MSAARKPSGPARFYTDVDVVADPKGWRVTLDGKTPTTPGGVPMVAPTRALADAIAAEWAVQGANISFADLPIMRMTGAALELLGSMQEELADEAVEYAETDLVAFVNAERPKLAARQEAHFAPLRAWAGETLGVELVVSHTVLAADQPPQNADAVRAAIMSLDRFGAVAFRRAQSVLGSFVLAAALAHGRLGPDETFAASRIDEDWQAEEWGVDSEAQARAEDVRAELRHIARFVAAAATPDAGPESASGSGA